MPGDTPDSPNRSRPSSDAPHDGQRAQCDHPPTGTRPAIRPVRKTGVTSGHSDGERPESSPIPHHTGGEHPDPTAPPVNSSQHTSALELKPEVEHSLSYFPDPQAVPHAPHPTDSGIPHSADSLVPHSTGQLPVAPALSGPAVASSSSLSPSPSPSSSPSEPRPTPPFAAAPAGPTPHASTGDVRNIPAGRTPAGQLDGHSTSGTCSHTAQVASPSAMDVMGVTQECGHGVAPYGGEHVQQASAAGQQDGSVQASERRE